MKTVVDLSYLLQNLPNSNNIVLSLEELNAALTTISPTVLSSYVPELNFENLFKCLYSSFGNQLEVCCSVLSKLLTAVNPSVILGHFNKEMIDGLKSENADIKNLTLDQIYRVAKNGSQHFTNYKEVLEMVIQQLNSGLPGVSMKAHNILTTIGQSHEGASILFSNKFLSVFHSVYLQNDIVKFKVYEVIVDIVSYLPDSLKYFRIDDENELNFIHCLIKEIFSNEKDVLAQLNAIEIITKFAATQHGFSYLENLNIGEKLHKLLENSLNDSLGKLLVPGLIKFFGSLCHVQPSLLNSKYRKFGAFLFELIQSKNANYLPIAVETVGFIGYTASGKVSLEKTGVAFKSCLPIFGEMITHPPTELRVTALNSLTQLIHILPEEQQIELLTIVENWFFQISHKDPVKNIISISSQPILELKLAAFSVLKELASMIWGQKVLKNCATFEEYLLDRRTEVTKEGLDMKYKIVQTLIQSGTASNIFGDSYWLRLKEYEREGRFYVSSENVVSFEGDDG